MLSIGFDNFFESTQVRSYQCINAILLNFIPYLATYLNMLIARVTLLYRYFLNTTLRPCPNRLNRRNLRTRRGPVRNPVKAFLNKIFRCTFGGVRPRTILLPNEVHVWKCVYKLRVHELLQHFYVELCVRATFHKYERAFESDCNPTPEHRSKPTELDSWSGTTFINRFTYFPYTGLWPIRVLTKPLFISKHNVFQHFHSIFQIFSTKMFAICRIPNIKLQAKTP